MHNNFFAKHIIGNWIVQNTNYFCTKESMSAKMFNNKIEFINLKNNSFYLHLLSLNLSIDLLQDNIELYSIQSRNKKNKIEIQYLLIISKNYKEVSCIKFNHNFKFINHFTVKYSSQRYFSIFSKINNLIIFEKIYCLNKNLRVIKTIIKKSNKFAAISFASKIKIN